MSWPKVTNINTVNSSFTGPNYQTTIEPNYEELPEVEEEQELNDYKLSPFQMRRAISKRKSEEFIKKKTAQMSQKTAIKDFILASERHAKFYTGTVFENHQNCCIRGFQFWHFPSIIVLLKLTCLVTLFDCTLWVFKN